MLEEKIYLIGTHRTDRYFEKLGKTYRVYILIWSDHTWEEIGIDAIKAGKINFRHFTQCKTDREIIYCELLGLVEFKN